jgi:hypothetical protein
MAAEAEAKIQQKNLKTDIPHPLIGIKCRFLATRSMQM